MLLLTVMESSACEDKILAENYYLALLVTIMFEFYPFS